MTSQMVRKHCEVCLADDKEIDLLEEALGLGIARSTVDADKKGMEIPIMRSFVNDHERRVGVLGVHLRPGEQSSIAEAVYAFNRVRRDIPIDIGWGTMRAWVLATLAGENWGLIKSWPLIGIGQGSKVKLI